MGLYIRDESVIGQLPYARFPNVLTFKITLQPNAVGYWSECFIAEGPHVMQKIGRQTYLYAFRFDAVIEQGKQVRNGLIRSVRNCSKAELFLRKSFLCRLIDKVAHVFFEQTYDMAGKHDRLSPSPLSSFHGAGAS